MFPSESKPFNSVTELLITRSAQFGERTLYTFLKEGEPDGAADHYSFAELDRRARQIAVALQTAGLAGQRVLLVYPSGMEFIAGFFGCLYAGAVAVPTVAPHPARPERSLPRVCSVALEAGARAVLTTASLQRRLQPCVGETPGLESVIWFNAANWSTADAGLWRQPNLTNDDLAFLQFTSGSTRSPRGVMLSHGNLLADLRIIGHGFAIRSSDWGIHWLPFYHDMGLIGGILETLYGGATSVFMSPMHFLQKPLRWLQAISHFKGNISGGPDFAFRLCIERATPEAVGQLDLSSWRVAFSGAEPVNAGTVRRFCETFAPAGFRATSVYPCFGLAESTLLVTGGEADHPPKFLRVEAHSLGTGMTVRTEVSEESRSRELVGAGKIGQGQELRIVDPKTLVGCAAGTVGEIWVSGPIVAKGYWDLPELTATTFQASIKGEAGKTFLRTGDLGFVDAEGELFFVGRLKDMIIVRGRNHYLHDLERTAESAHAAIRPGCVAAFAIELEHEEKIVVVCEIRPVEDGAYLQEVADAIREKIAEEHEIAVHRVVLTPPGSIPKTSSGKIRRSDCREDYLEDRLDEIARPVAGAEENGGGLLAVKGLESRIVELVAGQLKINPAEINPTVPFARYGLDSERAVAISGLLERELARKLAPALLYNYPTARLAAQFLEGDAEVPEDRRRGSGEAIAIIGMSCRFPGQANDPDSYWSMLVDGVDAIRSVPHDRVWPEDKPRWGGWLDDIDQFDPAAFGIAAREAAGIDPQQRLMLEVAAEALEDAGIVPESLAGEPVGVFVGVSSSDYAWWCLKNSPIDAWSGTGNAHSICANRLSYVFDLRGPSMAIDTACSSSLVAVHQACASLRSGETSMALVGGVNCVITTHTSEAFASARMLAPDGRCKTFDAAADGYVRGEGCGVIVLKPLKDAERDGDRVIAVIRGTAVNQDGRSNGLTAPNGEAQKRVIEAALADAGISADLLGYIEAHGTGTPLGDPIELDAIGSVLGDRNHGRRCPVGAVKTNIGHLEPASGIASLIKTALMVERGTIPPHLNLRRINPAIDLEKASYRIPTFPEEWSGPPERRFAGVNSFGFGGANAHVIVSGALPAAAPADADCEIQVLALSARSEPLLRRLALLYAVRVEKDSLLRLADVTRSANLGRTHHDFRLAIPAGSLVELAGALHRYSKSPDQSGIPAGRIAAGTSARVELVCPDLDAMDLEAAGKLWEEDGGFRRALASVAPDLDGAALSVGNRRKNALLVQLAIAAQLRSWGVQPVDIWPEGSGVITAAVLNGIATQANAELQLQPEGDVVLPESWRQLRQAEPVSGACIVSLACAAKPFPARALRQKAAELYIAGVPLNWGALDGRKTAPKVPLPFSPFERSSHWKGPKGAPPEAQRTTVHAVEVGLASHLYLRDHRVVDETVVPASWYLDQLTRIAQQHLINRAISIRDIRLLRPLILPASGEIRRVEFRVQSNAASARVSVVSAENQEILLEAVLNGDAFDTPVPATPRLLDSGEAPMPHAEFYRLTTVGGLQYGPGFRWLGDVQRRPGSAEARLTQESSAEATEAAFMHPGALDALLQLIGGAVENLDRAPEAWVPVSIQQFRVYGIPPVGAWAQADAACEPNGIVSGNARMLDSNGRTVVELGGVRLTRLSRNAKLAATAAPAFQYSVRWSPLPPGPSGAAGFIGRRILVLGDTDTRERAANALRMHGYEVAVHPREIPAAELGVLSVDMLALCWPPSLPFDSTAAARARSNVLEVALLAQALSATSGTPPALCLVTCGAHSADPLDRVPDPALGALSGLCRTLALEHPELKCAVVDLDPCAPDPFAALGAAIETLQRTGEIALAVRRGTHLVERLHPVGSRDAAPGARALSMASRGGLDKVTLVPRERRAPRADEVEIEVCAVGLNFRDVLQALDMIPGYGVFGGECSGRIVRVGDRAGDLCAGEEVVAALASDGCAADFVTVPVNNVIRKPSGLSFAAAAAVPMAYMTARYGLRDIARLVPGNWLLIHAAAGGVGFAAVQVALKLGVQVFATAGSPEKRAFLQRLGLTHVFDSRTLDFSARILELTGGQGVDAVLNSLAGPFIPASMQCLRRGGIFLELGKREIYSQERLRSEGRDLIYKPYDLISLSADEPALFRSLFEEAIRDVASGDLPAPPIRAFPITDAAAAFRYMAQARHIGKIVLIPEGSAERAPVRPRSTYLITGGTGALGLSTAERLANMGAERLVLTARREPGERVRERIHSIEKSGTTVDVVVADAANLGQMTAVLAGIDGNGAPLRGIIHCAGVLEDGLVRGLDQDRIERVLAPKIDGAWNLHTLTADRALDFFVLYSSAAAVFGNPGQAAYSAANAFLDSVAETRSASGLAASSINWGPWDGPGMADSGLSRSMAAATGVTALGTMEALDALEDVLRRKPVRRVVFKFDAARLTPHLGRSANLLAELTTAAAPAEQMVPEQPAVEAPVNGTGRVRSKLSADPGLRRQQLSTYLEEKIRACLDLKPSAALDPKAQLPDLGLDSLMTVELRSAVSTDFGYEISHSVLADGLTLEKLTDHMAAVFAPSRPSGNGSAPDSGPEGDVDEGVHKFWARMQPALDRVAMARALNLYHFEKPIASYDGGAWVRCADGERRLMLATHCYLGLLSHPRIKQKVQEAVEEFGGGVHGSRLMGGCLELHQRLEQKVAEFNGREAAITMSTGYVTNASAIAALVGPGDWVISDQLNHASILDGCNSSGALVRVYKHNNMEDLESVLRAAPGGAVKLVVADGVFSMDGDIADLPGLSAICRRYGALLMIDEAHSLGVLGKTGRGIEEHFGMPGSVDILMGTLSKTLSSMGGYIAGTRRLIDFLRLSARGYFFSTSPPAPVVAASLAALEVLEEEGQALCDRLHRNTAMFIEGLQAAGFDTGASCTAIVPAILGSDERAARMADYGQRHGLFVLPALPPAVPVGMARLRLTVSAAHTPEDLQFALGVLSEGARKLQYAAVEMPEVSRVVMASGGIQMAPGPGVASASFFFSGDHLAE